MTAFAVHPAAEGIYRGQSLNWDNPGYWTAEVCELTGNLDLERLIAAITDTVLDAEALHARFFESDGELTQFVEVDRTWRPEVVDLPDGTDWTTVSEAIGTRLREPAVLAAGNLFRSTLFRSGETVWWLIQAHHIVLDGYGYSLLYRQVARRYQQRLRDLDRFDRLADLTADPAPEHTEARRFWLDRLNQVPIRGFGDHPGLPSAETLTHRQPLGDELTESGSRWPHRLLAAVAAALHQHTEESTVVLGVPVADRLGTAAANVPAMVMNIAPLVIEIRPGQCIDDIAATVADELRLSRSHQSYRYEQLRRDLRLGNTRLFGPVVNIIPFAQPPAFPGCDTTMRHVSAGPVDDLAVTARGTDGFTLQANPAAYSPDRLTEIATAITRCLSDPGPVCRWDRLAETDMLTSTPMSSTPSNTTPLNATTSNSIPWSRRLSELAERRPDATALLDGDRRWSFAELASRVGEIAAWLLDSGVESGDLVGIRMPRGADAILAILGIRAAGAGYLPLDPAGAPERNERILAEAAPRLVLDRLPGQIDDSADIVDVIAAEDPTSPAYVIYTSGSTGTPKGVEVSAAALDHFIAAAQSRYRFSPGDRVLQFAPLHFDAHVEEVFVTLAAGACLVIRDDSATESIAGFMRFTAGHRITVLDLPTAYWHELALAIHHGVTEVPESVHTVIIGGEAAADERVQQWQQHVPSAVRLLNTYGPTEATVVCLTASLEPGRPVGLGTPLPGVATAIGPKSELYLAGPTLATRYLGDREAHRFIEVDGQRWYRTGDVVELSADGLRYLGRVDDEVKIAGHRVHPNEVEAALLRSPDVTEAAVVVDRSGSPRLTAFVGSDREPAEIARQLADQLPPAAIPARIDVRERLPRNSSGKIDYRSLREERYPVATEAPRTDHERAVHAVFTDVLGNEPATRHTDFFAAGGTSLATVAAASRLSARLGVPVTAAHLFEHPTVAALAAALSGSGTTDRAPKWTADRHWRPTTPQGTPTGDHIVLTGATGFVGAHVLARLLRTTSAPIRCIARGGVDRVADVAADWGLPLPDFSRVDVVAADLSQPLPDRDRLVGAAAIIHCAAGVSLNRGYDSLRDVNVTATARLLDLAYEGGSHFHQVSTVAVGAGRALPEEYLPWHDGLTDGYQQSKWVAEELTRQAAEAGLPVACHRLGRVIAATDTGIANPNDLVSRLIGAGEEVGALPDLPVREPWIPADHAAQALTGLVRDRATGVWNLTIGDPVPLSEAWQRLRGDRPPLPVIAMPDWLDLVTATDSAATTTIATFFALRSEEKGTAKTGESIIHNDRFDAWWRTREPIGTVEVAH